MYVYLKCSFWLGQSLKEGMTYGEEGALDKNAVLNSIQNQH